MVAPFLRPQDPADYSGRQALNAPSVEGSWVVQDYVDSNGFASVVVPKSFKVTYETDGVIYVTWGDADTWNEPSKQSLVDVPLQGGNNAILVEDSLSACITLSSSKVYVIYKVMNADTSAQDGWHFWDMNTSILPEKLPFTIDYARAISQTTPDHNTTDFAVIMLDGDWLYQARNTDLSTREQLFGATNFSSVTSFSSYVGRNLRYQILFQGISSIGDAP